MFLNNFGICLAYTIWSPGNNLNVWFSPYISNNL
jgi:hypothetical protein